MADFFRRKKHFFDDATSKDFTFRDGNPFDILVFCNVSKFKMCAAMSLVVPKFFNHAINYT